MIQAPGANVMNCSVVVAYEEAIPATLLEGRLLALFQNIGKAGKICQEQTLWLILLIHQLPRKKAF